jgi:hypothetical protein
MPFDPQDREPPQPAPRRRDKPSEAALLTLIVILALAVIALPIGGGSVVDAIAYLLRR